MTAAGWFRARFSSLGDPRRAVTERAFDLFARLAEPMLDEKELFIRKVIGWILREVSKKRPALSYQFLVRHRASRA